MVDSRMIIFLQRVLSSNPGYGNREKQLLAMNPGHDYGRSDQLSTESEADALPPSHHGWVLTLSYNVLKH